MTSSEFIEAAKDFVEAQLLVWPEARERYISLASTLRKRVNFGGIEGAVQFNPARSRSTTADISTKGIESRPCFLCGKNRPETQLSIPILEGWSLLLNPFPIFPIHFTIVSDEHRPQLPDLLSQIELAEKMPGMVIFFNGAKAGASAPDHCHFQAVLSDEIPLLKVIESRIPSNKSAVYHVSNEKGGKLSFQSDSRTEPPIEEQWPFQLKTAVICKDEKGMEVLKKMAKPCSEVLLNQFVWIDESGHMRVLEIPRKAHRPRCYSASENPLLVSPGAIDMGGVVITVRPEDFERASERIDEILDDVAYV